MDCGLMGSAPTDVGRLHRTVASASVVAAREAALTLLGFNPF